MTGNEEGRPRQGDQSSSSNSSPNDTTAAADALFGTVIRHGAYGTTTTFTVPEQDYRRGPDAPRLRGPQDAQAPLWWTAEAERVVLALIDAGHNVSSDDLHERFPYEPSASGAAFGGLFARLARAGRIVEVGMVKSRRPEARRRRIIVWGQP